MREPAIHQFVCAICVRLGGFGALRTSTFPLSRATANSPPDALAAMASTARGSQSINLDCVADGVPVG